MPGRVRFVCLLHSHQPVGNFDHVIEEAYNLSYRPYVEVFEQHPAIPLTHHVSGCLLEWLESHHPEYLDRLARRTRGEGGSRLWEMIGGGFYEPIMPLLPTRDRIGQIAMMSAYIEQRFGSRPRGLWLTERVWEPALVRDLADAGVEYLTLDDSHFRAAGLDEQALNGGYIVEDQGRTLTAFPASEKLRYMFPYAPVDECMAYLRKQIPVSGESIVCYADDGEKFGVWPNTFKHVFTDKWLDQFLVALEKAQAEGWLVCSTLSEAFDEIEPLGQACLPENSYREMTEWALPARKLAAYEHAMHAIKEDKLLAHDPRLLAVLPLVKGGNWRGFKNKYAEGGRMYAKMMEVSAKVEGMPAHAALRDNARTHLYRGQCNCPYWHGVFGGMYLPHLRSAVYSELVKADKLASESHGCEALSRVEQDFDFDHEHEFKLANESLALYLHPRRGGHLYEFDLRFASFNAGDTFSRRYEAYHDKVARAVVGDDASASIHDRVLAKEKGLEKLLQYDAYLRESLVDHLSLVPLSASDLLSGNPPSEPGFRDGRYEARPVNLLSEGARSFGIEMFRRGRWNGAVVQLSKRVILGKASSFEVQYVLELIEPAKPLTALDGDASASRIPPGAAHLAESQGYFGIEMNYNLLAGNAHDRYLFHEQSANAGPLETAADFGEMSFAGLVDEYKNVRLTLHVSQPGRMIVAPVKTVSQSEGGFESVYQSTTLLVQWPVTLAADRPFVVSLKQEAAPQRD